MYTRYGSGSQGIVLVDESATLEVASSGSMVICTQPDAISLTLPFSGTAVTASRL